MKNNELPQGWRMVTLKELGEVNRGRSRHRPRWDPTLYGGKYPFIQTGDVKSSGGRITNYAQTYNDEGLSQSRLWPNETLCITIAANIAETGILTFPACFPDSIIGFIADKTKCNVYFVEYIFRHLRNKIQHEASGTVQDNINLDTIDRLEFPIPTLPEQNVIVNTLKKLDDKIEVNQNMNHIIDQISKIIFKHWFIDFEFTNEGTPYKSSGGKMEDSELGKIPKGWKVGKLNEFVEKRIGGDWGEDSESPKLTKAICLRGIDLQRIKETGFSNDAPIRWIKQDSIIKRKLTGCDILIGGSGLGPIGRTLYFSEDILKLYNLPIIYSNFCKCIHAENVDSAIFIEKVLELMYQSGSMQQFFTGTSIPNLDLDSLLNEKIIMPPKEILSVFTNLLKLRYKYHYEQENLILANIRDTLLPKLIVGKLRIDLSRRGQK